MLSKYKDIFCCDIGAKAENKIIYGAFGHGAIVLKSNISTYLYILRDYGIASMSPQKMSLYLHSGNHSKMIH